MRAISIRQRSRFGRCLAVVVFLLLSCLAMTLAAKPVRADAQPSTPPRTVEIGLYIANLFDLNFAAGNYKVTFWIWFKYEDPAYQPEKNIELVGARDLKIEVIYEDRLPDGRYYRAIKYLATINQTWDVHWFPFDTQDIRLVVESAGQNDTQVKFLADLTDSYFDPNIIVPGWRFRGMRLVPDVFTYQSSFGAGADHPASYPRLTATMTLERIGERVFGTAFLGFFVANMLTGTTLLVEAFEVTRGAIPFIGRLNMVVGALFGAVGNKYIVDNSLPPMATFSVPDVIQVGSFSAIGVALVTLIASETMARMGAPPSLVSTMARANIALYLAAQLGVLAHFNGSTGQTEETGAAKARADTVAPSGPFR